MNLFDCPFCGNKGLPSAIPELAMCTSCANTITNLSRDWHDMTIKEMKQAINPPTLKINVSDEINLTGNLG